MDNLGGSMIFDEIMESIDDKEEIEYILDAYNLSRSDLSNMNFEKKTQKRFKNQNQQITYKKNKYNY